jgi:hypothetical protein
MQASARGKSTSRITKIGATETILEKFEYEKRATLFIIHILTDKNDEIK